MTEPPTSRERCTGRPGARSRPRLVARGVLLPLLVIGLTCSACGGNGPEEPQAAPGLVTTSPESPPPKNSIAFGAGPYMGPCLELQEPVPSVDWLPPGLPLPPATYPIHEFPAGGANFRMVLLAVPMQDADFVRFARDEWPAHGWVSGQSESEPGETEIAFLRGDEFGGIRVRPVYCEDDWTEVLVVVGSHASPKTGP